ncbi:hypothetical protein GGQ69_003089 [Micrococcus sp. TA1]|nr:hypothetical protein [Micrococcus sp. TA1]
MNRDSTAPSNGSGTLPTLSWGISCSTWARPDGVAAREARFDGVLDRRHGEPAAEPVPVGDAVLHRRPRDPAGLRGSPQPPQDLGGDGGLELVPLHGGAPIVRRGCPGWWRRPGGSGPPEGSQNTGSPPVTPSTVPET